MAIMKGKKQILAGPMIITLFVCYELYLRQFLMEDDNNGVIINGIKNLAKGDDHHFSHLL